MTTEWKDCVDPENCCRRKQVDALSTTPDQALEQFAKKVREQCEKACESEYVTEVDADDAVYNSAITYALRAIRAITEIPK